MKLSAVEQARNSARIQATPELLKLVRDVVGETYPISTTLTSLNPKFTLDRETGEIDVTNTIDYINFGLDDFKKYTIDAVTDYYERNLSVSTPVTRSAGAHIARANHPLLNAADVGSGLGRNYIHVTNAFEDIYLDYRSYENRTGPNQIEPGTLVIANSPGAIKASSGASAPSSGTLIANTSFLEQYIRSGRYSWEKYLNKPSVTLLNQETQAEFTVEFRRNIRAYNVFLNGLIDNVGGNKFDINGFNNDDTILFDTIADDKDLRNLSISDVGDDLHITWDDGFTYNKAFANDFTNKILRPTEKKSLRSKSKTLFQNLLLDRIYPRKEPRLRYSSSHGKQHND